MPRIGSPYGEIKYEKRTRNGAKGINIWHFKVDEASQGHGHGSSLLLEVVHIARNQRAEFVTVNMGGGIPAKKMLESNGFTVTSCNADPELNKEDRHVDGYLEIPFHEWAEFPEDVPEEEMDDWIGWTQ